MGYQKRRAAVRRAVNPKPRDWLDDDIIFFATHPRRVHRIRKAWPGEAEGIIGPFIQVARMTGNDVYIVIRRYREDVDTQVRLVAMWPPNTSFPDTDEFAHALFDTCLEAQAHPDGTFTPLPHIIDRAKSYEHATRQ